MNSSDTRLIEKMAELSAELTIAKRDVNAAHEKHRLLETKLEDLDKDFEKIKNEVSRYKWIMTGIAMAIAAIATLVNYVASLLNVNIIDFFDKK